MTPIERERVELVILEALRDIIKENQIIEMPKLTFEQIENKSFEDVKVSYKMTFEEMKEEAMKRVCEKFGIDRGEI